MRRESGTGNGRYRASSSTRRAWEALGVSNEERSAGRRALDTMAEGVARTSPKRVAGAIGRNISMANWLTIVVLTITIIALLVNSLISFMQSDALAGGLLDDRVRALRALKSAEIESYFRATERQTLALAESPMALEALDRFAMAYAELGTEPPSAADATAVVDFYRGGFGPDLAESSGVSVRWSDLAPSANAAVVLQAAYVAIPDLDPDERRLIDDAGDGSDWSSVHVEFHSRFVDIAERLEFDDLYLIEPQGGTIVYSAAKRTDFGTSLDRGPYSGSTLASLIRALSEEPEPGAVRLADLAPYGPALGEPVGFLASPIVDGDRLAGFLAVSIPVDEINAIMTSEGDWEEEGFGETGETYLAGADGRMRSISRTFLEDPASYYEGVQAAGSVSEAELASIRSLGTTVVFQRAADIDTLEAAAAGDQGVVDTTSYLNREVAATYEAVDIEGLEWFVALEVERDQVAVSVVEFRRRILLVVSIFVLVITFVTVGWARRALAPVRAISGRLRNALEGDDVGPADTGGGPLEMEALSDNIDRMMDMTRQRREQVTRAAEKRLDTLRGLLPATVVDRLELGDRLIVEQILQASIAVVAIDGLGELIRNSDASASRSALDEAVDILDAAAEEHGLERVKVIGDVYYAGCGLTHPYLDHAPRSVAFASEVKHRLRELSDRVTSPLEPATGVHSGPVSVGLAGSSRLVYDAWGSTLSTAYLLAHRAASGEILISDETKQMLPPEIDLRSSAGDASQPIWEVVAEDVTERSRS
jgi:class 3 adenylate cyclase